MVALESTLTPPLHRAAEANGWLVHRSADRATAARWLPPDTDLIVAGERDVAEMAAIVRAAPLPLAAVPVVALGGGPVPPIVDEVVPLALSPMQAAAMLERWAPAALPDLTRLDATFGTTVVDDLLARFAEQLDAALLAESADAHRIAGNAGLLGFAGLGGWWRAVDEGDDAAFIPARHATRRTLLAIRRRLAGSRMS